MENFGNFIVLVFVFIICFPIFLKKYKKFDILDDDGIHRSLNKGKIILLTGLISFVALVVIMVSIFKYIMILLKK